MNPERHITFTCRDGLSLFCRDLNPELSDTTPILCLPGLTRNSKDFLPLSRHYQNHRFLCPDFRGRGLSQWDTDPSRYHPLTYVEDMWELLTYLDIHKVILLGASLGGLMAMIMANTHPNAVSGIILNDIGPHVNPEGHARVKGYVGLLPAVADWPGAVRQAKEVYEIALPDLDEEAWLSFTQRQYREDENGVPRLEYDPAIGTALRDMGGVPPALWSFFESLQEVPILTLRGAISDILSPDTFDKMAQVKPNLTRAIIPNRGHVPLLDEPESLLALDGFLASLIDH
uniref:Pimeloyl-ACP methyl ester carboxylesterase n=1 Tax=Candidatus Kentrum sp. MB TaxID=2138164 RepID=A0A451BA57_9GAMM|nr:MAG: Pimeloyl-ACP methyl ester carboxylesterase [Candidatus Kentron sp. MB]VFK30255.1 MAG: Pimeloyl-ACP methyl ester carboxylesterase [Candidatus Kentron sp. MB]VFK75155.1 MAG: Pimeloyl-ACP methyl ester carboxylesterase [Candidatus Kentron sp. MB]